MICGVLGGRRRAGGVALADEAAKQTTKGCENEHSEVYSAFLALSAAEASEGVSFQFRPLLAGKASLTESGFVETRALGTASFAPELRMPVELVYRSASEESGLFGHGWSSPQLESSAKWDKDGLSGRRPGASA